MGNSPERLDPNSFFYEEKLKAAGWQSGLGNAGGGFVDVNKMMEVANQSNPVSQTMILTKGKQSLTLIVMALPLKNEFCHFYEF